MSRNRVAANVASSGGFVNLALTLVTIALIASAYFSAVGQFAGAA